MTTKDYKNRATRTPRAKPQSPGIVWFLAGMLFGVSLIGLAWLKFAPTALLNGSGSAATPQVAPLPAHLTQGNPKAPKATPTTPASNTPPQLEFEFPNMLRNAKVELPEQNTGAPVKPTQPPPAKPPISVAMIPPISGTNTQSTAIAPQISAPPIVTRPKSDRASRTAKRRSARRLAAKQRRIAAKRLTAKQRRIAAKRPTAKQRRIAAKRPTAKQRRIAAKRLTAKKRRIAARRLAAKKRRIAAKRPTAKKRRAARRLAAKKRRAARRLAAKTKPSKRSRRKSSGKQLGAFANVKNAQALRASLALRGIETRVRKVRRNNRVVHIVTK